MAESHRTAVSKISKKSKSSTKIDGKHAKKARHEGTHNPVASAHSSEASPRSPNSGGPSQGVDDVHPGASGGAKFLKPGDELKSARGKTSKFPTIRAILGIAIVATFLAAVILVLWQFKSSDEIHSSVNTECRSAMCRSIIKNITELLDKSIEPCNDFYGYVCNKWWNSTGMNNFMQAGQRVLERTTFTALESASRGKPNRYGMHLLGGLYTTCMTFLTNEKSSLDAIVKDANKYVNISAFFKIQNFTHLVLELGRVSLMLGIHTTFALNMRKIGNVTYFNVESYKSMVHKAATVQDVDAQPYQHNAKFYIEDAARSIYTVFNLTSETALKMYQDEVQKCDQELFRILNKKAVEEKKFPLSSIVGLLHTPPIGDVVKLINRVIPGKPLQPTDTILVTNPDIIAQAQTLLASKPLKVSVAYSLLSVLEDVSLPYVLKTRELGSTKPFICVKVTQGFLRHTWPFLMSILSGLSKNAKPIETMGLNIRNSVIATNALAWMDESTRKNAYDALKRLVFYTLDRTHMETLSKGVDYSSFQLQNDGFVDLYFRARAFEMNLLLRETLSDTASAIAGWRLDTDITYMTQPLHWIVVPVRFQGTPLYYPDQEERIPFYINYATLGVLMAREIVRAIDQKYIVWSRTSQTKFGQFQACLNKVGKSLGFKSLDASLARAYGSRLAYEAVRAMLQAMGKGVYEKGWSTAQDFFFIRSCMMSCSKDGGSTDRQKCHLPVYSNPDFSIHYRCAKKGAKIKVDPCVGSLFRM
ncbi:uncharacterized protein LOC135397694 [Ornithodoros turicata]|uniref:uncharacterized protein LOC135397694 n=1 Tax=Ornithodoros turicata TaxID=34597 RepID=UPI00313950BE